jgi:cardiolipin synthase A/B
MLKKKGDHTVTHQNIITPGNIEIVHSGEDYFLRLQRIINQAQHEIHLQTYIFENDTTGIKIADCLKEAAGRNVTVYVLLDAFGSKDLPKKFTDALEQQGIHFRYFSPLLSINSFFIGRRLHHKIVVADGTIALIGGINIADKYRGTATEAPWLDYAVQIEGKIAAPLLQRCKDIYAKAHGKARKQRIATFYPNAATTVHVLQNDWVRQKKEISTAYLKAIRTARKEIIIVASYFLPGIKLIQALKNATRKGVTVKLVLSGISDVPLLRRATRRLYTLLLRHRMELYEWNTSVLHAKVAVADGNWTTIGSYNLNHLSSYGSIEMNVEIISPEFAASFIAQLNANIAQCEKITTETHLQKNGIIAKCRNWLSYRLVRIGLILITYLPYKRIFKRYHAE